jgi:hypothetical protein
MQNNDIGFKKDNISKNTNFLSNTEEFINRYSKEEDKSSNESDSCENYDFDLDYERLTLIQVKSRIKKHRDKKMKNIGFINKKRIKPETQITYNSFNKRLYDTFCPNYKELKMFLEQCKVVELNSENIKDNEENSKIIFDPFEFMEKNNIIKTALSFEDDLCQNQKDYEEEEQINSHCEIKEIIPKLSAPKMSVDELILDFELDDFQKKDVKDDFNQLKNIIYADVLEKYQKNWMSDFFKKINELPLNKIICKEKKLEIIFDLDLTCIYSFVNNINGTEAIFYKEKYPEKNIHVLSFEYTYKKMFSSVIIRNGLKDFIDYVKELCNFHIRTQGVLPYALQIAQILEKHLNIRFKNIKSRECRSSDNKNNNNKNLEDLGDDKITNKNSIIIDDTISVWKQDLANVIQSKKFIDKECGVYSQKEKDKDKSSLDNDITRMQNTFSYFYYHKIETDGNSSWKCQTLCTEERCPFYQYKDKESTNYNMVYSGEYLNSPKLQFIYLKNVIKIIYYLLYHYDVPIFEAIKLIRLNSLNGKYFFLKYLDSEKKSILSDIIKVCGGEIITSIDDSIYFSSIKTIFLVCSMENYINERYSIKNDLKKNKKYILINERFILDSYYFMTDLGNSFKDKEYNPEKCYNL